MTHDDKITYMRLAAGMCNFGMSEDQLDLLLSLYEAVVKKEGSFTTADAIKIKYEVKERDAQRAVDEEAREHNRMQDAKRRQAERESQEEKKTPTE